MKDLILIIAFIWMLLFVVALSLTINYGFFPTSNNAILMYGSALAFIGCQSLMQILIAYTKIDD